MKEDILRAAFLRVSLELRRAEAASLENVVASVAGKMAINEKDLYAAIATKLPQLISISAPQYVESRV